MPALTSTCALADFITAPLSQGGLEHLFCPPHVERPREGRGRPRKHGLAEVIKRVLDRDLPLNSNLQPAGIPLEERHTSCLPAAPY